MTHSIAAPVSHYGDFFRIWHGEGVVCIPAVYGLSEPLRAIITRAGVLVAWEVERVTGLGFQCMDLDGTAGVWAMAHIDNCSPIVELAVDAVSTRAH